jgi:hypothetical protein
MTLCGELALEEDRLPNGDGEDVGRPEVAHH